MQKTDDCPRLCEEHVGVEIAHEEAREDDVTELPAGGAHEWRISVLVEYGESDDRQNNSQAADAHGHDCEYCIPPHVLQKTSIIACRSYHLCSNIHKFHLELEIVARRVVFNRPPSGTAIFARVDILDELEFLAALAHPATGVSLEEERD